MRSTSISGFVCLVVMVVAGCSKPSRTDGVHTLMLVDGPVCPDDGAFKTAVVVDVRDETGQRALLNFPQSLRGQATLYVNQSRHRAEIWFGMCRERPATGICEDASWFATVYVDVDPDRAQVLHFPMPSEPIACASGSAQLRPLPKL